MKAIKNGVCVLIAIAMALAFMEYAIARTVTLTTRLIVTVKPAPAVPETDQNRPGDVAETYEKFISQSVNPAFIKTDTPALAPGNITRYTVAERL